MGDTSAVQLTALVRQVLPKLQGHLPWDVEIVEQLEDVGVSVQPSTVVVRIQESWLKVVYDSGLSRVTRHFPLALTPIDDPEILIALWNRPVTVWGGITLELVYQNGAFTGGLNVGPAYVARTLDGLGLYAHEDPIVAGRKACSERRSKLCTAAAHERLCASLRSQIQSTARDNLEQRTYDSEFETALAPFRDLLPSCSIRFLQMYGSETVPLRVLEKESVSALPDIPDHLLGSLFYELESAVRAAQLSTPSVREILTEEDLMALEAIDNIRWP